MVRNRSRSEFDEAYDDTEAGASEDGVLRGALLTETIRVLAPHVPLAVRPETTVRDAIREMNQRHVGCAMVVDQAGKLVGIFTERDLLTKVVGHDKDPRTTLIGDAMTRNPETLGLDDGLAFALNRMSVGGFRHIPLVDSNHKPVGLISVRDLIGFIVSLYPRSVLNLPPDPGLETSRMDGG